MTPTKRIRDNSLAQLIQAAKAAGDSALPVETWHPEYCGEMDMVIRKDGSWWHDGVRITRAPLIKLFSKVLRKDEDGHHYLVTPAEKIRIIVECAAFMVIRVDVQGKGDKQRLFFTTATNDVAELGPDHYLKVQTDPKTQEPTPLLHIRGRLEALLMRPVFYELVEHAIEKDTDEGRQLGVMSGGMFFPLGPAGIHDV